MWRAMPSCWRPCVESRTHKVLAELLLSTGEDTLAEAAPGDYYWGIGADGSGENRLGRILEQVRTELRA